MTVTYNNTSHRYGKKALTRVEDTRVVVSSRKGKKSMEIEVGNFGAAAFLGDLIGDCLSSGDDCSVIVSRK